MLEQMVRIVSYAFLANSLVVAAVGEAKCGRTHVKQVEEKVCPCQIVISNSLPQLGLCKGPSTKRHRLTGERWARLILLDVRIP